MSDDAPPPKEQDPPKPPVDDLFGDDELGPPPPLPEGPARRRAAPVRAVALVIGGLVLVVLWYFASLNHDRWYLRVKGEQVSVERGYYFPIGSGPWTPTPAYEPFDLPAGVAPERSGGMTIDQLDEVLLKLFVTISERELGDLAKGDVARAERMLRRANRLRTLRFDDSTEDRLMVLQGDVAFRKGLTEVRGLQVRLDEALRHFRRAAMHGGEKYKGAERWVEAIGKLREDFRRLSRESGLDPDKILVDPPASESDDENGGPDSGAE